MILTNRQLSFKKKNSTSNVYFQSHFFFWGGGGQGRGQGVGGGGRQGEGERCKGWAKVVRLRQEQHYHRPVINSLYSSK